MCFCNGIFYFRRITGIKNLQGSRKGRFSASSTVAGKMPTYEPEAFSLKKHSLEEIAQTMCQSEIVHEVIVMLSFLPLIEVLWFDSFFVFLSTSVASACFDMMFVIMQRFNRQRILNMIQREQRRTGLAQSPGNSTLPTKE